MLPPHLPESAPFTPAQRAWLNGFFEALVSEAKPEAPPATEEEHHAWHDPALGMDERMSLAKDRPIALRMMAAMAQLDCGACGYLCKTYAEAIAFGHEKSLSRCVPGGGLTARKLKELISAAGALPVVSDVPREKPEAVKLAPARFLSSSRLNAVGSEKDTRMVCIGLEGSGLTYQTGDSLGVKPVNDPELVAALLKCLKANGREEVEAGGRKMSLWNALLCECEIVQPGRETMEWFLQEAGSDEERTVLARWMEEVPPEGAPAQPHLIDLLERFPVDADRVQGLLAKLNPLRPRLYSISSSPLAFPNEIHLTIAMVRYEMAGRARKGVASTYLGERARPGDTLQVTVRATPHFRLPADDGKPVIMIGPGTGIAPFRGFLQERLARGARGPHWLFFGDQHESTDFLYKSELEAWVRGGLLTRLDTAFSRDQAAKRYVQHRMLERGAELWKWLQEDASLYVCGDARRMAKDVDAALHAIAREHGGLSAGEAKQYLLKLAREKRYCKDIY
ncbi:MAG: sulfite reductase subunit alpha [Planctomycetota bacterium]|nr:sulfite reductase subunit alpha [Planctomycetota bacterium]